MNSAQPVAFVAEPQPPSVRGRQFALVSVLTVAFIAFAGFASGARHAADWDHWTDLGLLAVSMIGVGASWWRYRFDGQRRWLWFVGAWASNTFGQLMLSMDVSAWLGEQWPSAADLGALGFYAGLVGFLLNHLRRTDRASQMVVIADAVLMALGCAFMTWEWIILPGAGDVDQYSAWTQVLLVLYPFIDAFAASVLLLLLLVDRSRARVLMSVSMVLFVIADVAASARPNGQTATTLALSAPGWIVGGVLLIVALGVPGGARVDARRPTAIRMIAVHGIVTAGLWTATWKYIVRHHESTTTTAVIGGLLGLAWAFDQLALNRQAASFADRLRDNIDELRDAQDELRSFLNDLPDAVVVLARDGSIREVNTNTETLTGRSREQLMGHYLTEFFNQEDRKRLFELWQQMRHGAPMVVPTLPFERPDGSRVLLEADANVPVRDPDRVVIALRDVTHRVAEAHRLEKARERFRLAFHGAPTGMALSTAPGGVLIDVNESLVLMLGRSREDLIDRTVEEISHPDDWDRNSTLLRRAADRDVDGYRMEKRYVRGDGGVVWARTWVSIMDDGEGGTLAIAHIEDITEQRHNAERLEWAATHDGLTGLPNRFRFLERLGAYLETSEPGSIAVLFIDIDNFKVINDSLGHDAGDQLLQSMSERLRSVVRDRDMLGRFGGDEFIVMLRDISGAYDPFDVAEQLRAEIAQPLVIDGAELFVTASIGITISDREGVTTTEMLRDADAAMYRAKARGRDCVEVFAPGSHDATVLTLRTTNELRRGLERGEIVPYYQPIVQLGNGHLVGFEVLARWRHPDRGLLGPDQFLPMAEETGLIGEVGAAVLRASLAQLGQWRNSTQRFNDLSVSVNVSVRQLMSSHLVDVVADALAEAGVSASALWLEITETALMADVKAATVALRELRSLGLHLAVDDFGTGYSSLTYLKRFPVEAIKVDRTFVNGLGIDLEDSTIVEAVVNLGHSLGLSVVAEGVETPLQLTRLREIGCDRGQGYLFGRPRPAELVEAEYSLV